MRPRILFLYVFVLLSLAMPSFRAGAAPVSFQGKKCFFGVLHAHSVLSPDFEPQPGNMTQFRQLVASTTGESRFQILNGPYLAYKRAAEFGKLDFLALTDHVHGPEGGAQFCSHEMPPGGYQLLLDAAAKINNDPAFSEKFLAILVWNGAHSDLAII